MTVRDRVGRGLSRREMIRRSVAAGAAAWTAPVIVDSLASPAAAGSLCINYFGAKGDVTGGSSSITWAAEDGTGNCNISSPINGKSFTGTTTNTPTYHDFGNGVASVTVSGNCARIFFVRIHYGNLSPSSGTCVGGCVDAHGVCQSGNVCFDVPLTTTCSSPPSSTCGCASADGKTVYFPTGGISNIHVIWCC